MSSSLEQNWHVPTARRASTSAHILPTTTPQEGQIRSALCGARHRNWVRLANWTTPDEEDLATRPSSGEAPQQCRSCLRRWRASHSQTTTSGFSVPTRYRSHFERYLAALAAAPLASSTRRNYASGAAAFLRWAPEAGVTPAKWGSAAVAAGYATTLTDLSSAAVNLRLLALTDLARRLQLRTVERTSRLSTRPDDAQVLRPSEIQQILIAAHNRGPRSLLAVEGLLYSGAKPGQILTAQIVRAGDDEVTVTITPTRQVAWAISPDAAAHLQAGEPVCAIGTGGQMSPRRLRQLLADVGRDANIEDLNPTAFRDTWIAAQLAAATDPDTIRRQLGLTKLNLGPVRDAVLAQRTQELGDLAQLPPRRHRMTRRQARELLEEAQQVQEQLMERAGVGQIDPAAKPNEEIEITVLRQVLHPNQIDLSNIDAAEAHRLTRLLLAHRGLTSSWLIQRPVALSLLLAPPTKANFSADLISAYDLTHP